MSSYNRVVLMGNVTRPIELRYTANQTAVCEMGLAINDKRKGANGEWIEETTFVDVTLWGRTAEVASEHLTKGNGVLIEGRLKLDQWDDKQTGQKRSKLGVVADAMRMLGKAAHKPEKPASEVEKRPINRAALQEREPDDIPF